MDFIFDYISVSTYWTVLLIVHSLLAVGLLGALTHQAVSVAMPVRKSRRLPTAIVDRQYLHAAGIR